MFKLFDKDGNGTISFNEFLEKLRVCERGRACACGGRSRECIMF